MTNKKVLIHDRRVYANVDFDFYSNHILSPGTNIKVYNWNACAEAAFKEEGVPDIYIVGWTSSMYPNSYEEGLEFALKDIKWAKTNHSNIPVIAWQDLNYFDQFIGTSRNEWEDKFKKAGADEVVEFLSRSYIDNLMYAIGKYIGFRKKD